MACMGSRAARRVERVDACARYMKGQDSKPIEAAYLKRAVLTCVPSSCERPVSTARRVTSTTSTRGFQWLLSTGLVAFTTLLLASRPTHADSAAAATDFPCVPLRPPGATSLHNHGGGEGMWDVHACMHAWALATCVQECSCLRSGEGRAMRRHQIQRPLQIMATACGCWRFCPGKRKLHMHAVHAHVGSLVLARLEGQR